MRIESNNSQSQTTLLWRSIAKAAAEAVMASRAWGGAGQECHCASGQFVW